MITAVYCTLLPADHVLSDLCTWIQLLNDPSIKYSVSKFFVALFSEWLLWGMLLMFCLWWLQWMCDVSDSSSKMFCCMLTAESGRCGAHVTVVWCWPWSAECKRPKCCRCGDFWADATDLYWGTSTCNRKFWVSLLDVGDGAVSVGKRLLVSWVGFRFRVVCFGVL
jgi:hypothetical protein